jgi:peptidyl-prolyl cis-trans isomerase B (cyclophilin B)
MIQGGGMDESFSSKKTKEPIENEAKTAKSNRRGTIAMARTNAPHSATAQFFINVVDNPFLDYKDENNQGYCVFGEVTSGMDIVDAIVKVKTGSKEGHQDVPVENVLTHSITEE